MPVHRFHIPTELKKLAAGRPLSPGVSAEILAWTIMPADMADELSAAQELQREQKRKRAKRRKPRNLSIIECEKLFRLEDPRG